MADIEIVFRIQSCSPFAPGQPLRRLTVRGLARRQSCPQRVRRLWGKVAGYGAEAYYGILPSGLWAAVLHGAAGFVFAFETLPVAPALPRQATPAPGGPPGREGTAEPKEEGCATISPWTVDSLRDVLGRIQ